MTLFGLTRIAQAVVGIVVLSRGPTFGAVTDNSVTVNVRASGATSSVLVEIDTDPSFAVSPIDSSVYAVSSSTDFTANIPVSGLATYTTYYARIRIDGVWQNFAPYPQFRTFQTSNGQPLPTKIVILTDFKNQAQGSENWATFASVYSESPDLVFVGGDYDHRNPNTIAGRRTMFKQLSDPAGSGLGDWIEILHKYPIAHQWDDHDAGGNNLDKNYTLWADANQVFREYVPSYPLQTVGIWQTFRVGPSVDVFVLDCRNFRDSASLPDDSNKSMLGSVQKQALLDWLIGSPARWKLVFTSVVANTTTKCAHGTTPGDGWCVYQNEFSSIRNFIIDNSITGVVFVSADLHSGGIDDGTNMGFPEMVVPAANLSWVSGRCSTDVAGAWSEGTYWSNTSACNGYGVVEADPLTDSLKLTVKDQDGVMKVTYTVY